MLLISPNTKKNKTTRRQHQYEPTCCTCQQTILLNGKKSSGNVSTRLGGTFLTQNQELIIFYFCKTPVKISWIEGDEDGIRIPAVCKLIDRKETRINGRSANVVCNTRIEAREQHQYRNWRVH
jgi:hypothetical protein